MIDFVFNFLKRLAQICIGAVQNLMIIINTALSLVILYLSNVTMLTSDAFILFFPNSGRNLRTLLRMLAVPRSDHFYNSLIRTSSHNRLNHCWKTLLTTSHDCHYHYHYHYHNHIIINVIVIIIVIIIIIINIIFFLFSHSTVLERRRKD